MEKRPTLITVIAILAAIAGVLEILGGMALVGLGAIGGSLLGSALGGAAGGFAFLTGSLLGIILIGMGALDLVAAYGAWSLKKWAWTLLIVLSAIGILLSLMPFSVVGIVINGVIIYLVYTNKAAFTK